MAKQLTNKEYVAKLGNVCPVCKGTDISAESLESDANEAWRTAGCESCGASWTDHYKLTHFGEVQIAKWTQYGL